MNIQSISQNQNRQQNFGGLKFNLHSEGDCTTAIGDKIYELSIRETHRKHPVIGKVFHKIAQAQRHLVDVVITGFYGESYYLERNGKKIEGTLRSLPTDLPENYLHGVCNALDEAGRIE